MIIPLVPLLPAGSSNLPESLDGPPSNALLFGLAPGGVCLAADVTIGTGKLLPHRFTLTLHVRGGLLSVALSCSSPRLGVTQHLALWSPDFPPVPTRGPAIIRPTPNSSTKFRVSPPDIPCVPGVIGHHPRHSINGAHNKAGVSLQGLNGSETNSHDRAMRPCPKQSWR